MNERELEASLAGTRCLVTGGAGFIGSNLVRYLLQSGATVTVIDNMTTGKREHLPEHAGLSLVQDDIRTFPDLGGIARVDYLFHLAAQVGNIKSIEHTLEDATNNILGTVRLLDESRNARVRKIVYSSSSAIFGEAERLPVDENHPQRPASFYALSKQTGEQYTMLASALWATPAVCLRYFNVYGLPAEDSEYSGVISIFMRALEAGAPLKIFGDGRQSRDFVYVKDVVQALVRAAVLGTPGAVFNIGTGTATTITELARILSDIAGKKGHEILYASQRSGEVRHSVAAIDRARSEIGYAPVYDLPAGLRQMWAAAKEGKLHA